MGALKDFIIADRVSTEEMTIEELRQECGGWRAFVTMVPDEVMLWVVRQGEAYKFTTRKYEPKAGILTSVKFEPVEFSVQLVEPAMDSLRGRILIEEKLLQIPKEAILYGEEILTSESREDWEVEEQLATTSLEG